MLIQPPCEACNTAMGRWIAEHPAEVGRLDWHCPHVGVALSVRIDGGEVVAWTAWSSPDVDAFNRSLAFRAGGEEGVRAALEAEAAIARAGGAAPN